MRITIQPAPFDAAGAYNIEVSGGTPPYTFEALPEPPNPPGVVVQVIGDIATVTVSPAPPPGTQVQVLVQDGATPPQATVTTNTVR